MAVVLPSLVIHEERQCNCHPNRPGFQESRAELFLCPDDPETPLPLAPLLPTIADHRYATVPGRCPGEGSHEEYRHTNSRLTDSLR
jgi:hypothetical protein